MAGSRHTSVHLALRVEAALHRLASRTAARRGYHPGVASFTGYGTTRWVRVLGRVVLVDPANAPQRGRDVPTWRPFMTLEQPGVPVTIEVGGVRRTAISDQRGYLDVTVEADLAPGWRTARLLLEDGVPTTARLRIVDPAESYGIVSDIDDTVIVTMLPRPLLAAWNTFFRRGQARRPVPGMSTLYAALLAEHPGAPVFYVSTGAWNAAPMLRRFLVRTGYPEGPMLLTDWGPTPAGWFRSGAAHKRAALLRLADEFPQVRWLLVGDDGQHDPQLYAEFAAARPDRVRGIAIRQLTPAQAVLAHGAPTSHPPSHSASHLPPPYGVALAPAPTVTGPDGDALAAALRDVGLLAGSLR